MRASLSTGLRMQRDVAVRYSGKEATERAWPATRLLQRMPGSQDVGDSHAFVSRSEDQAASSHCDIRSTDEVAKVRVASLSWRSDVRFWVCCIGGMTC